MPCLGLQAPSNYLVERHCIGDCPAIIGFIERGVASADVAVRLARFPIKVREAVARIIDEQPLATPVPLVQKKGTHFGLSSAKVGLCTMSTVSNCGASPALRSCRSFLTFGS